MDFDVSVFIITTDRQYIPASEYDGGLDGEGAFVMLTNDELDREFNDDNSICIYKDWFGEIKKTMDELKGHIKNFKGNARLAKCEWQIEYDSIPDTFKLNIKTDDIDSFNTSARDKCVRKYLDGYRTNQEIMRNVTSLLDGRAVEEYLPAIMVAHHTKVPFDGKMLNGYLPVIGQLLFIAKNIGSVNTALRTIDRRNKLFEVDRYNNQLGGYWWSAMETKFNRVWYLLHGAPASNGDKTETYKVLPLFVI